MSHIASPATTTSGPASFRRFARDAAVFVASAAVIAGLVLFAFAAPSNELVADVGPVVPRPASATTVEGRVLDAGGGGLEDAAVFVRRVGGATSRGTTDETGAFRVAVPGDCSAYVIRIVAETSGEAVRTTAHRHLCPGDSLPIEARVVTRGHFLWVPGPR